MDKLMQHLAEIKKLYNISEAEEHCLMQMSMMVKLLGYSPELTIKLLRALSAMMEAIHDEMSKDENNKSK